MLHQKNKKKSFRFVTKWRWVNAKSIFYFRWTIFLKSNFKYLEPKPLHPFLFLFSICLSLPQGLVLSLWDGSLHDSEMMTNSAVSQSVGGTQWVSQWPPDCCYNTTDPQSHHPLSEHVILSLFSNTHLYNNQKNNHKQKPLSRDWEGRSIFFIRADASLKGTLAGVGKSR